MCDRIKEEDQKYQDVESKLKNDGCFEINQKLTDCMNESEHDWRACKSQLRELYECVQKKNKES